MFQVLCSPEEAVCLNLPSLAKNCGFDGMQPGRNPSSESHGGVHIYHGKDVKNTWMSNPSLAGKSHIRFLMALSELRASGERHVSNTDLPLKTGRDVSSLSEVTRMTEEAMESLSGLKVEVTAFDEAGQKRASRERLSEAAASGDEIELRKLAAEFPGLNWDMLDSQGRSALMVASELGHETCVQYLLDQGAHVRVPGALFERTALHWAALGGSERILATLMESLSEEERLAELNRGDSEHLLPLHIASRRQLCSKKAFLYLLRQRLNMSSSCKRLLSESRSSSAPPQPTALKPIRAASPPTLEVRRAIPSRRVGCPPTGRRSPSDRMQRQASRGTDGKSRSNSNSPISMRPNTTSPVSPFLDPSFYSPTSSESFSGSREKRGGGRERWLTILGSRHDLGGSPSASPSASPMRRTPPSRGSPSLSSAKTHDPFPSPSSKTEHSSECPPVWRRVGRDSLKKGAKEKGGGDFMAKLEKHEAAKNGGISGAEALINAVINGRSGGISHVAFGLDVNEKGKCGRTALMVAAELGKHDCMKKLLMLGARVMIEKASIGRSAMHWAAAAGQGTSLELLMENMSVEEQLKEVNRMDADGKTPLALAAEAGVDGKEAFVFLIKKGGEYGSVLPTILLNLHMQSADRHTWSGPFQSPSSTSGGKSRLSLSSTFT